MPNSFAKWKDTETIIVEIMKIDSEAKEFLWFILEIS